MKVWLVLGTAGAGLAVALGAFGAHGLKTQLPAAQLETFETAVRYQIYHSLALLVVGVLAPQINVLSSAWSGTLFTAGIILFCGSLYLLALTGIRFFGMVTPLGGVSFIMGWLVLLWGVVKS